MGHPIEDALNRGTAEQRERSNQVIAEARQNINTASLQKANVSSSDAEITIAQNEQIIAEAERSMPAETYHHDFVSPPPPMNEKVNSEPIELHPDVQSHIEKVQQGPGNNYLNQDPVEQALARPTQEASQKENSQQELSR